MSLPELPYGSDYGTRSTHSAQ